ncbi:putative polysaccharide biosynthesis protein [Thermaerobacillus caldiproteolyticus]|uniref:putative polysaccharide biosynthesis protein n=1 Tax=Thermaerobacillus caldiproteolyticus TaxID=247480 RepID=UPI0018F24D97|nr:polysaccharide biosynthesis protein [Anoxybacillus caldiproteolyticus]
MALDTESPERKIWKGTMVLTVAAFITKILSAFYRIPYQNIVGDLGFYIYQQVYPIYAIAVSLATYGYPVVISKLVAERIAEKDEKGVTYILRLSLYVLLFVGLSCFSLLYMGAGRIAKWMGDSELVPLIRLISFSFLLLPFISVLRGYFQGNNRMTPTAVSQVGEQSVRVLTIVLLSYVLFRSGETAYEASAGALFGSLAGGFTALLLLIAYWMRRDRRGNMYIIKGNADAKTIICYLFLQGVTICITNMVLTLIQLVDAFSLLSLLMEKGVEDSHAAKLLKGIYDRGQPLIQLGTVIATSFSLTLVPLISGAKKRGDEVFIREKIDLSIRVAFSIGMGAALGLVCLIRPTNVMLFENDRGSLPLAILSASILFTTMSLTLASLLQGIGEEWIAVAGVAIAVVTKWLCNIWLVQVFGTVGAALATLLSYAVMALFLYFKLQKKMNTHFIKKQYMYPVVNAALAMVAVLQLYIWVTSRFGDSRLFAASQALFGVMLGGFVYIIMLLKGNLFSKQELSLLPFGDKLRLFLQKNR